jgi:hypothetical protein
MNTISFDTEKAKLVERTVCREFGTTLSDIVSFRDSLAKKVVVFLLTKQYGYDKRILGHKYQMTYLYVPTVVAELEHLMKVVPGFEGKINAILKQLDDEKILDLAGSRNFAPALS